MIHETLKQSVKLSLNRISMQFSFHFPRYIPVSSVQAFQLNCHKTEFLHLPKGKGKSSLKTERNDEFEPNSKYQINTNISLINMIIPYVSHRGDHISSALWYFDIFWNTDSVKDTLQSLLISALVPSSKTSHSAIYIYCNWHATTTGQVAKSDMLSAALRTTWNGKT